MTYKKDTKLEKTITPNGKKENQTNNRINRTQQKIREGEHNASLSA